ncbi:hypothetical protein [Metamycoplasma buccale]|uniref:hypothetical protein n=1 Tax=Metamycoplasma buccale TaxID=55602 RepID=UPI00398E9B44
MSNTFKYLAIGDSIGQGFNSKIGSRSYGYKNANEIFNKGYSYPDYLVEFILDYVKNKKNKNNLKLQEFWRNFEYKNIGLSVLRIKDLNDLFLSNVTNDFVELIKLNKKLVNIANSCTNEEEFWNVNDNKNFIHEYISNKFVNAISEANLITISIGGNEYQSSAPFSLIRSLLLENNYFIKQKILQKLNDEVFKLTKTIENDYVELIKNIRRNNKDATIVLISYAMPFFPFLMSYQEILTKRNSRIFEHFFDNFVCMFDDMLLRISKSQNVLWTKTFENRNWKKYAKQFYENTLDVHPTELGYQEMARNIFITIINNKKMPFIIKKNCDRKIFKFNISHNLKISKRNKKFYKRVFLLPKNSNRLIYIFRCWMEQNRNVQNPYFALFKRELNKIIDFDNYDDTKIVERTKYSSLVSLILENAIHIVKYLPKDSKIYSHFNQIIKNQEKFLYAFSLILNSTNTLNIIDNIEKIKFASTKYKLDIFLNKIMLLNEQESFSLFKEMLVNNQLKLKTSIIKIFEILLNDIKNHKPVKILNETINTFWYEMSFDKNVLQNIEIFVNKIIEKIPLMETFETFNKFICSFVGEHKILITNLIKSIIDFAAKRYENKKEEFSQILLKMLKIKQVDLIDRDWIKLNKIINKFLLTFKDIKVQNTICKIFVLSFEKINIWKAFDFGKLNAFKYFKLLLKTFGRAIIKNIFNKTHFKIYRLFSKLLWFKLGWKMRNIFK